MKCPARGVKPDQKLLDLSTVHLVHLFSRLEMIGSATCAKFSVFTQFVLRRRLGSSDSVRSEVGKRGR